MSQPISLQFRHTADEFKEAIVLHRKKNNRSKAFKVFSTIILIAFGIIIATQIIRYFYSGTVSSGFINWLIATAAIFLFVFLISIIFSPKRVFKRTPRLQQEFNYQFSEEKIHLKTEHYDSDLQWSIYTKVIENQNLYLLMQDKNLFTIIPKRAFSSKEQEKSFRQLLTNKQLLD